MVRGVRWRILMAFAAVVGGATGAVDPPKVHAAPPIEPPFSRRLEQRITLSWHGQQLGAALGRLSEAQDAPLWVDRRVDTSTPVDFEASEESLLAVLRRLAAPHQGEATPFHDIIYFGPKQTADELATLAALARAPLAKMPADRRRRWLSAEAWSYPRLSEPRKLLQELADSTGATVEHADRIPHDLWPAQSHSPLPVVDRAVLVLSGFDLTCEISPDGSRVSVVPIERPVVIARQYGVAPERLAAFDAALADLPAAADERHGRQITVTARDEDHVRLRAALAGQGRGKSQPAPPTNAPRGTSRKVFTLKIENRPLVPVLEQLARQLSLEIQWADDLKDDLQNSVASCDVRDASLDGLLKALLAPAGLAFERTDQVIRIRRQK